MEVVLVMSVRPQPAPPGHADHREVYEAVRANRMPCIRIGRHIRFTRAMLEQWLDEQRDDSRGCSL